MTGAEAKQTAMTWGGLGVVALVLTLAGCGDEPAAADRWVAGTDPVDTTGLVYAADGVVHLGDGSTIDLGTEPEGFVLAGDGVYFVPRSDGTSSGELFLATRNAVESTGAQADATTLRTSPDGRILAFIDDRTGDKDRFDTPVATAVVVDVVEGRELVRSTAGMGDPEDDETDLMDLYEDASGPEIIEVTEDTAYVATPDGSWAYALEDGEGERLPDSEEPWEDDTEDDTEDDPAANPSGTWRFEDRDGPPQLVPVGGGRPVVARSDFESWSLWQWLDDETVLGLGRKDPDDPGAGDTWVLLTCTLPSGRCVPVAGTEGGVTTPVNGLRLVEPSPAAS